MDIQDITISALVFAAVYYLGRKLVGSFGKKNCEGGCGAGCASGEIKKVVKRQHLE